MIKLKHDRDYIKDASWAALSGPKNPRRIMTGNALPRHHTTDTFMKIATLIARILLGLLLLVMGLDGTS
jgi:hypothetical protein